MRTIGQDLADLRPEYLEIEFNGQIYIARGRARRNQSAAKQSRAGKILAVFRRSSKGSDGQRRESPWFERTYPLSEIHRLDESGQIQRKNYPETPDIYVLGERLRTLGKMIEAKNGQLLKLTMNSYHAALTFRNSTGEICDEEHSTPALYRSQQDENSRRGTRRTRDPWETTRPSNAATLLTSKNRKFKLLTDSFLKRPTRRRDER